jgi:hypothetical protein
MIDARCPSWIIPCITTLPRVKPEPEGTWIPEHRWAESVLGMPLYSWQVPILTDPRVVTHAGAGMT